MLPKASYYRDDNSIPQYIREYARYLTPNQENIWIIYQAKDNSGQVSERIQRLEGMSIQERFDLFSHVAKSLGWISSGDLSVGVFTGKSKSLVEREQREEESSDRDRPARDREAY